ncbi:MAG: membrane protein insertion efficiency factor YidD [Pseudomonadota bacterium]
MRRFLIGLIKGYQTVISPHLGQCCRFHPSCSCYAQQAIERHGPIKGLSLTTRRILRCHPFTEGGIDPVP